MLIERELLVRNSGFYNLRDNRVEKTRAVIVGFEKIQGLKEWEFIAFSGRGGSSGLKSQVKKNKSELTSCLNLKYTGKNTVWISWFALMILVSMLSWR